MLDSTQDFKDLVYKDVREFKGRATITMDAFSQVDPVVLDETADFTSKVTGSNVENIHVAKYVKSGLLRTPDYTGFAELNQGGYNGIKVDDATNYAVSSTTINTMSQYLFGFNVIGMMEQQFGKYVWGGKTALADKIALAKTMLTNISATWIGYGTAPTRPVFRPFRYIRDWLNGNTVNANNYWNEIQCMAGTTNRAAGKTPTISSGTLTNGVNLTDGSVTTYGYEASANGIAKYIQIDLGYAYCDVDTIKIYHYYADGRTFHGTKTEISQDGINWYTLYDSAVSGEYVETSAGKTYTSTSGGNQANFTIWDNSKSNWGSNVTTTSTTPVSLTRSTTYASNVIEDDGFVYFMVWAFSSDGTTASYVATDYISFNIEGSLTTTRIYDDDTIMSMDIIEQMSILNDTLPSNQLTLTLHNNTGELDLLTFANMQQVIASKPTIQTEIGLVIVNEEAQTTNSDYAAKVIGSVIENPNKALYVSGGVATDITPWDTLTEFTQGAYDLLKVDDAAAIKINTTLTSGNKAEYMFQFDIVEILERQFGTQIWRGKTVRADKVTAARALVSRMDWFVKASGTSPTGNKATLSRWSLTSWYGAWTNTSATPDIITNYTETSYNAIDDNGYLYLLLRSEASDGVTAASISCEYIYITITTNAMYGVEWIPTGSFILTDWKNDVMNKIITLNCNDYFYSLGDISYDPTATTNLKTLAAEVLTRGGVPTTKQIIDSSLNAITVNKFPDRIDCRTALQHIGVAGRVAVYQDREGNVVLKTFQSIDEATNYVSYPSTQGVLYGYPGSTTYSENSTGSGMKYIDFDQMYNPPEIALEKSVYQVVVLNYADPANSVEIVYTNDVIAGMIGDSFSIDNPLINNAALADKIAAWYIRELNYNAIYTSTWRQNPILECADMILVEDSFGAEKQSRIIQQELRYQGYLDGITTSRGGV